MFNKTAELFIKKHGLSGLDRLRALCNSNASLLDIASNFHVSISTAGRLREILFRRVYYVSDATADWLKYCEQRHDWISEQYESCREKATKEVAHLTLIRGDRA